MTGVCFYISGHGFGHASRQIEIVNALGALVPEVPLVIRTSAPRWLFHRTLRVTAEIVPGECDTGVVQLDSLHLDAVETIRRADEFHRTMSDRAHSERTLLQDRQVSLVVSDAPALGCAAAHAAGIPSVVISNFTWDWIYEGYAEELRAAPELSARLRDAYAQASAGWRLPLHAGFEGIRSLSDVPFVARHARAPRDVVRAACGLPRDARVVLLSFGGYGVNGIAFDRLDCLDRYVVLLTGQETAGFSVPAGVVTVSEPRLYESGFRYEDLVRAVDVVLTKPGYGIISECVANDTALLYTSRGRFAEYDVLVREMPKVLQAGFIDNASLFNGRWAAALDAVLAAQRPAERPPTNGADVIARMMLDRL